MIALGIAQRLLADTGFNTAAPGGIYPLLLPDNATYPAASYQTISSASSYTVDGKLNLVTARVQVDCWAKSYPEARALAIAVRTSLEDYAGRLPNNILVSDITCNGEMDLYESEAFLYRVQSDWKIRYRQP